MYALVMVEENMAEKNGLNLGGSVVAETMGKSRRDARLELPILGIYETAELSKRREEALQPR